MGKSFRKAKVLPHHFLEEQTLTLTQLNHVTNDFENTVDRWLMDGLSEWLNRWMVSDF